MLLKTVFTLTLVMGTGIALSATNWISAWIGLELNLMSFIPLIMSQTNQTKNEAAMKYFLVQSLASIFLVTGAALLNITSIVPLTFSPAPFLLITALSLKMGAAPLHFWFPGVMQNMTWMQCMILATWQKLAPLVLLVSLKSTMILMVAVISSITGAMGGFNQMLTRKILAYSSINHMGWMITATLTSENLMLIYFTVYSILNATIILMASSWNINHLAQAPKLINNKNANFMLITNLLSLGGIPPFLGFLPKWMMLNEIIKNMPTLSFILTMTSLITLYFYLRVSYTIMLKSPVHSPYEKYPLSKPLYIFTSLSFLGTLLIAPMM